MAEPAIHALERAGHPGRESALDWAWRSRTLGERIEAESGDGVSASAGDVVLLERWREKVGAVRPQAWQNYLALRGFTEERLLAVIAGRDDPMPRGWSPAYPWLAVFEGFAADAAADDFFPWLVASAAAMERGPEAAVLRRLGASDLVLPDLQRALAPVTRATPASPGMTWRALLDVYPVLARVLATLVEQHAECCAELISRLRREAAGLSKAFGFDTAPERLVSMEFADSDRHANGRRVGILRFEGGTRLVYKPRSVALEAMFGEVLEACSRRTGIAAAQAKVVEGGDSHGWMEFLRPSVVDVDSAPAYFRSAGQFLAVAHAMAACDLHFENVFPTADGPALIDGETLLAPWLTAGRAVAGKASEALQRGIADSVHSTGFLPRWRRERRGVWRDTGGMAAAGMVPDPAGFAGPILDGFRLAAAALNDPAIRPAGPWP